MVRKTLESAQGRFHGQDENGNENGSFVYVRRYGKNDWHMVVVRPTGEIESQQKVSSSSLVTQFGYSGRGRYEGLRVDSEKSVPALFGSTLQRVQSGEHTQARYSANIPSGAESKSNFQASRSTSPAEPNVPAGWTFESATQAHDWISENFNGALEDIGAELRANYKASAQRGNHSTGDAQSYLGSAIRFLGYDGRGNHGADQPEQRIPQENLGPRASVGISSSQSIH